MFKFRSIIFSLVIVMMAVLLPGCSGSTPDTTLSNNEPTIAVTDSIGRVVQVPEHVQRIAALYSFAGYAVCLLGRGNDLVAVPNGLQRDVLLVDLYPAVARASTPMIGGVINIEELLRVKPDLVIVWKTTVINSEEAEKLDNTGIPYIVIDYSSMAEEMQAMKIIGEAIGRADEADSYNKYYTDVINRVQQAVKDIPEDQRVTLLYAENQATRTTGNDTIEADWTRTAGLDNVSVGRDLQIIDNDYYASIEQILLWDPEVIICNETTAYNLITKDPQWSSVKAVRDGKVYLLPDGVSRWGHPSSVEIPLALLWAVKTIYPDRFTQVNMKDEIRYYYKTFFNIQLDDDTIAEILEGGVLRLPKGSVAGENNE